MEVLHIFRHSWAFKLTNESFHYCTQMNMQLCWCYRGTLSRVKLVFHLGSSDISPHPNISQSLLTEGNEWNITFHCQQGVAMTTSHRCHRERVTFIELHWLWYPRILLFSSQAATGPLAPGVHLPFCREQKQKKKRMVTKLRVRTPACINSHRSLTDGSVGLSLGWRENNPEQMWNLLKNLPQWSSLSALFWSWRYKPTSDKLEMLSKENPIICKSHKTHILLIIEHGKHIKCLKWQNDDIKKYILNIFNLIIEMHFKTVGIGQEEAGESKWY